MYAYGSGPEGSLIVGWEIRMGIGRENDDIEIMLVFGRDVRMNVMIIDLPRCICEMLVGA